MSVMHHVLFLVPLVAVIVPAAYCLHLSPSGSSTGRHRQTHHHHHWPHHAITNHDNQNDNNEIDSCGLRHALQQLLELNDGELQALMSGMSPRAMAPRIEPTTAFLLASSRQYLERLNTILSTVEESSPVKKSTWNPKIARRHKKERSSHKNYDFEAHTDADQTFQEEVEEEERDPDSILGALTELSAYLSGTEEEEEQDNVNQQERKRRSHHHHETYQEHDSTKYEEHDSTKFESETRSYLYYMLSKPCPFSADGINRKKYCPSPSILGERICIDDVELCDGTAQCPNEEDEAPTHCLFHNAVLNHLQQIEEHVTLWRHRS